MNQLTARTAGVLNAVCFLLVLALPLALGGCEDEADGPVTSTDAAEEVDLPAWQTPPNLDCPDIVTPRDGPGAPRGECCYRGKPNSTLAAEFDAREAAGELEEGEQFTQSYRLNFSDISNHPLTLGAAPLPDMSSGRGDGMESVLIFQFTTSREGGERVSGPGMLRIGPGKYNCDDGTFSYFDETAAPIIEDATYAGADDPSRWMVNEIPIMIDATKEGTESTIVAWEDRPTVPSYSTFVVAEGDGLEVDFELVIQDFDIIRFHTDEEHIDCQGSRDGDVWVPDATGAYEVYASLALNNATGNGINLLQGASFCNLISFGVGADIELNCETEERCVPGEDDCIWKRIPEALCPITDDEQDIFRCHVGTDDNVDGIESNCTETAPTERSEDNEGQCCDPLGESDTLPACNAYRIENNFVAASAVVTEETTPDRPGRCN